MYYQKNAIPSPAGMLKAVQLGRDNPADYKPDPGLVDAVNVALVLNKPLLLTGDPGTGKTQLAFSVAWQLAGTRQLNVFSPRVERFEAKSTSLARDLFYSFDSLRRFQAAYAKGSADNFDYITFNALGNALINALPDAYLKNALPRLTRDGEQRRSVVLIDEIDKAPRDFPNDLLNEIEQMFFRVPELENRMIGGAEMLSDEYRPIVIISSNSEKNLPDPFLRRCIYYNIPFPDREALHGILLARIKTLSAGELVDDSLFLSPAGEQYDPLQNLAGGTHPVAEFHAEPRCTAGSAPQGSGGHGGRRSQRPDQGPRGSGSRSQGTRDIHRSRITPEACRNPSTSPNWSSGFGKPVCAATRVSIWLQISSCCVSPSGARISLPIHS
jgi:MoxR-like ATPase